MVGYRDSRDVIGLSGAEGGTPRHAGPAVGTGDRGRADRRPLAPGGAAQGDVEVALHRPFDGTEAVALQAQVDRHAAALGRSATLITSTV